MITKILGGSLALSGALCLFLYVLLLGEQRYSAKLETRNVEIQAEYDAFANNVRLKSEEITRKATELARDVETRQTEISNEVSADYQQRLAALRLRYERLRTEGSGTNPGGAREANLPEVPGSAGRPDAAAQDYTFRCEADAIQLIELQRWVREQQGLQSP